MLNPAPEEPDAEPKEDATPAIENPALITALKAFTSLTREQKAALSKTLEGFVACLAPLGTEPDANPHARAVITEEAWENRANWGRDEWNAWETWGWYRQFCRAVSLYLLPVFFRVTESFISPCLVLPVSPCVLKHTVHCFVCEVRSYGR